jgi:membrane fusion protein, multidrug efflux system
MRHRPTVLGIFGLGLVSLTVPWLALPASAQQKPQGNEAAPAVIVQSVKDEEVSKSTQFVGRVQAIQQTDLKARVEGFLEKVMFKEGALVTANEQLYQIETGPYDAALASANAALAQAQAAKAGADATLSDSDLTLERQKTLLKSNTVSQAMVDKAQADRDNAYASVQNAIAQIQSANAQIETAQLNLSYTKVISPIDGRIGKTNYTMGNLVSPSSGTLSTVVQMNPIRVVFSISDRDYVGVIETATKRSKETPNVDVRDDFVPTLILPNGQPYSENGKISFIDNKVDPNTGTISVYADFTNEDFVLIPGQFVSVNIAVGKPKNLPVVPAGAVLQDKDGPYVLTVDKDNRAQIQRIKTADKMQTGWAVSSGLQQGDTIIVQGIQKVKPGEVVNPQTAKPAS